MRSLPLGCIPFGTNCTHHRLNLKANSLSVMARMVVATSAHMSNVRALCGILFVPLVSVLLAPMMSPSPTLIEFSDACDCARTLSTIRMV